MGKRRDCEEPVITTQDYCDGIDVSGNNGPWNWTPYKDDAFGIVRATSWDTSPTPDLDPEFGANWDAMRKLGIGVRVAYHELRVDKCPPLAQADTLSAIVHGHGITDLDILCCAIDAPYAEGQDPEFFSKYGRLFCRRINQEFPGHRVLIYCDPSRGNGGYCDDLWPWRLWIANYDVSTPEVPRPWASRGLSWSFWQTSGAVPPDRNLFRGSKDFLHRFARREAG